MSGGSWVRRHFGPAGQGRSSGTSLLEFVEDVRQLGGDEDEVFQLLEERRELRSGYGHIA